jgi:hypothetical protein
MRTFQVAAAALMLLSPSAFGGVIVYDAILNGPNESPPTASAGTGFAVVDIDTVLQTMRVVVTFSGLTSGDTASHIHCCTTTPFTGTAGVATTVPTFTDFPLAVTSGSYDHTFDLTSASSYNPAFVTAEGSLANAEAALLNGLNEGVTYLNIHTTNNPGGEIRGFLVPVPEPSTFLLAGAAIAGLLLRRRR